MDVNAPIDTLDMSVNQLTKIPTGVGKFSQLVNLRLNNNSVTSIGTGDGLNQLKANVSYLDLSNNLIETIENASLPRKQWQKILQLILKWILIQQIFVSLQWTTRAGPRLDWTTIA